LGGALGPVIERLALLYGQQIFQAALFYEQVKAANPGANITFTGHSLGGGIASVMSVWFDRPATTFAEAPFGNTASSSSAQGAAATFLAANGYFDNSLLALLPASMLTPLVDKYGIQGAITGDSYGNRTANVTHYYVDGEIVSDTRFAFPAIIGAGQDNPIFAGDNAVSSTELHSMVLTSALLMQNKFRTDTIALPNLLAEILDTNLYARPLEGAKKDFLNGLLNDQIRVGYDNADGELARFAGDIDKLTQYGTNLKDGDLGKALIN
jgi:hypothetical protein